MRMPPLTQAQADEYLEAAFDAVYDLAAERRISDALATVLLLEALLHDCHVGGAAQQLRAYIDAALNELSLPPETEGETTHLSQAAIARNQAADALVLAIAAALAVDLETTVLPGHPARPN